MPTSFVLIGLPYIASFSSLSGRKVAPFSAIPAKTPLPSLFRFPHPTGPYAIGTLTYHWVDAARSEAITADSKDRRELMVQIWYPAKGDQSAPRVPYMPDADAVTAAFARIHHKPAFIFGHFKYVTTNAISSAPSSRMCPSST